MNTHQVQSFCLSPCHRRIYAGLMSGEILVLKAESLQPIDLISCASGGFAAMVHHPKLPLLAALSLDRHVYLQSTDGSAHSLPSQVISTRSPHCPVMAEQGHTHLHSLSQALCFDPYMNRLVSRTSTCAIAEWEMKGSAVSSKHLAHYRIPEDLDVVTIRALPTGLRLTGDNRGNAYLHREGQFLRRWRLGDHTLHWFEPIDDENFLVASDDRRVFKLNIRSGEVNSSKRICRDDFEHISLSPCKTKAYATSFDRNVYEVCVETLTVRNSISLPFKLRWISVLKTHPHLCVVQCMNGGLYLLDTHRQRVIKEYRKAKAALWTSAVLGDGSLVLAGEGDHLYRLYNTSQTTPFQKQAENLVAQNVESSENSSFFAEEDTLDRIKWHSIGQIPMQGLNGYIKRMDCFPGTDFLAAGSIQGEVFYGSLDHFKRKDFSEPVRDLCFGPSKNHLFVATEHGSVYLLDHSKQEKQLVFSSDLPIWCLGISPNKQTLATVERTGDLCLIDVSECAQSYRKDPSRTSFRSERIGPVRYGKRLRWLDDETLLIACSGKMMRFSREQGLTDFSVSDENTCEDFDWDEDRRYLAYITYNHKLILCDFDSGEELDRCSDGFGYSKGVRFVRTGDQRRLVVTYGRDHNPSLFEIYNEQWIRLGSIKEAGSIKGSSFL